MTNSEIFKQQNLQTIETNLKKLLNDCKDFDNARIISSPRAVGDTVQEVLGEKMASCFPCGLIKEFNGSFARRAMADVAFTDASENYFVVDIKTHNKNTDFNMPNLTCDVLDVFYPKEIDKIKNRIDHFSKIRAFWESKAD